MSNLWAIRPETLEALQAASKQLLRNDPLAGIQQTRKTKRQRADYSVFNSVAVLDWAGVTVKRPSIVEEMLGAIDIEQLGADFQAAVDDDSVEAIILKIDSPGGTVNGTAGLADLVFSARGRKTIVSLADGMMASAAYWIGSAADKIYVANETTLTGSIGVVGRHVDFSSQDAKAGLKVTTIRAGQFKAVATEDEPLSDLGRSVLQEQVDSIYEVFLGAVARNRGINRAGTLAMADGRVFVGRQAIRAGLVDGISTLGTLIADLNANPENPAFSAKTKSQRSPYELARRAQEIQLTGRANGKNLTDIEATRMAYEEAGAPLA